MCVWYCQTVLRPLVSQGRTSRIARMESNNSSPASTTSNSGKSDAEDAQGQVSLAVVGGSVPSTGQQEGSTNVTSSAIGESTNAQDS